MRAPRRSGAADLRSHANAFVRAAAGRAPIDGAAVAIVAVLVCGARRQRYASIVCAITLLAEEGFAAWWTDGLHLDVGEIEAGRNAIFALAADMTVRQRWRCLAGTAPPAHVADLIRQRATQSRTARLSRTAQRNGVEALADAAGCGRSTYGRALARAVPIRGALPSHRGAVGTGQGARPAAARQIGAWACRWRRRRLARRAAVAT
jgi:hypothetical protein